MEPLLIVGASARAAAFSALRGGFSPRTIDLFADVDLAAQCPAEVAQDYPRGLVSLAAQGPACPWLYTGGLENSPEPLDAIAARQPLWGNRGQVLRAVRDPARVASALQKAGLPACEVAESFVGLPRDGTWLRKPRRSAGGARIAPWIGEPGEQSAIESASAEWYFQRRVAGRACSAVFLADPRRAVLLGVTEQLIGTTWLHAQPFHYAGSVGPLPLEPGVRDAWHQIGQVLATEFKLVGLFGVDAIEDGGTIWPVEVNPRYTASTEVLERAGGFSAVARHVATCGTGEVEELGTEFDRGWFGKAILFARGSSRVPAELVRDALAGNEAPLSPRVADIPRAESIIPAGAPVLTCLEAGASRAAVLEELERQALRWERALEPIATTATT